ncbi:conserved hypothetical protein [Formosa agariphila KMM 3901]|uniref:DUF6046 domain-containing protein n=1 Tax=Formosa agariphila (strain DSM 15362 / KCTC 12365 / LMG 23005 / KMM 3901 / M-2Alg 35-1) TaxID=1347342 RepID=T2KPY8_FORAG|nr:DUF6046 domain-containing protein [Formosa agariphila]CDF80568.1 conserved hypothetical protein [Formosa agariphila KMM 3901]
MSTYRPDISQLFNAAFGVIPITYKVDNQAPNNGLVNYQSIPVKTYEAAKKMSWMGTPIMFPMKFKGGSYQYYKSTAVLAQKQLNDFELPPATMVDFRRAKNITKTQVLGSNGTVKEIYGFDDWQIRIRGLCLDTPNQSAYEQHLSLLPWEGLADSIEVLGELFIDKSIYRITLEDVDFKQAQGKENVIPFEITASSDEPLELVL